MVESSASARSVLVGLALIGCIHAASARAQGTARSMDIEPSAIASGMGGASAAVFWGDEPNYWSNPALLGYHHGVRWQYGKTRLVPGLASDVFFETKRLTLAGAGLGFEFAGEPFDVGGLHLDYGRSESTDESGNLTGMFGSWEDIEAFGAGVSLGRLVGALAAVGGDEPPDVVRHFDVALGFAQKHTEMVLVPDSTGRASAGSRDWGMLARVGAGTDDAGWSTLPVLRVDVAYAYSVINYDDASFVFPNSQPSPPTRTFRNALAVRIAALAGPAPAEEPAGWRALLRRGFGPLFAVGYAFDWEHSQGGDFGPGYDVHHDGAEMTFFNVLSIRMGSIEDRLGQINGGTLGYGIAVPVGDLASFRYDFGTYPQAQVSGLEDVHRRSYSVFIDPLALWRELR